MRADLTRLFLPEAFKPCLHTNKSVQKELSDSVIPCTVAASDRIQVSETRMEQNFHEIFDDGERHMQLEWCNNRDRAKGKLGLG